MENLKKAIFSVSDFVALTNQTLEYSYAFVDIEGEVSSFKINQGKYVFFDIKDDNSSVACFMSVWQLRVPIEDGMKVVVTASPKLTNWGKFSLTVRAIRPSGEGSIKKSFELLKSKLDNEGLFAVERKRSIPLLPSSIAVISSIQSAGYTDFIKILDDRWGGLKVNVINVQVQGVDAPEQIINALNYFNTQEILPEVIVIVRGGGSADDLSTFNDEELVRAVAASRVPTLVGIGHEIDVSLVDLVCDLRASTPSNAAQILVPDRQEYIRKVQASLLRLLPRFERILNEKITITKLSLTKSIESMIKAIDQENYDLNSIRKTLNAFDPRKVLERGYAVVRGEITKGAIIDIEKRDVIIKAEVKNVTKK